MIQNIFANLRLCPPSEHSYSRPSVNFSDTKVFRWASSRACQISSSEYLPKGSRLKRIIPENRTGSCHKIIRFVKSLMSSVFKTCRKMITADPFWVLTLLNEWQAGHLAWKSSHCRYSHKLTFGGTSTPWSNFKYIAWLLKNQSSSKISTASSLPRGRCGS